MHEKSISSTASLRTYPVRNLLQHQACRKLLGPANSAAFLVAVFERLYRRSHHRPLKNGRTSKIGQDYGSIRAPVDLPPPVDLLTQVEFFKDTTSQNPEPSGKHRPKEAMWRSPVSGVLGPVIVDRRWFLKFKSCRPLLGDKLACLP